MRLSTTSRTVCGAAVLRVVVTGDDTALAAQDDTTVGTEVGGIILALGASFSSSAVSVADESYSSLRGLLGATASVRGAGAGCAGGALAGLPPLAVSVSAEDRVLSSVELRGPEGRSATEVSSCSFFL